MEISLLDLVKLALKYIHLLIISALVCAVLAFSYCHFLAVPKYSASGSLMVTNGSILSSDDTSANKISGTDINASLLLMNTVNEMLNTSDIYKELADNLGSKYTYSDLMSRATVKRRSDDTLFIDVSFTASTSEEATRLTNSYLKLAPHYVTKQIINSSVAVMSTAEKATQTFPRTMQMTLFAAIIGMILCFAIICIVFFMNKTIKTEDDIKQNYDIPLIGSVPDFTSKEASSSYSYGSYSGRGGHSNAK